MTGRNVNEYRLLAMIDEAEKAGRSSPSNSEIAEAIGFEAAASSTRLVTGVASRGLIAIVFLNASTRRLAMTDKGRARLAAHDAATIEAINKPPPRRASMNRPPNVSHLPAAGGSDEIAARAAAVSANDRFLRAAARLAPVADAIDRDRGRYARLPPPTLSGQAFS